MHGEGRKVINSQKRGSYVHRGLDASDVAEEASLEEARSRNNNGGRSVLSSAQGEKNDTLYLKDILRQEYKPKPKETYGAGILKVIQKKEAS